MSEELTSITLPKELQTGDYANAFRVVSEEGLCTLEFIQYSASGKKAVMVSRVQVHPGFLIKIRDRLGEAVEGHF